MGVASERDPSSQPASQSAWSCRASPNLGFSGFGPVRFLTASSRARSVPRASPTRAKSTGLFVDETLRFIEANKDKPFFVNLWTLVPHATLHPTEEDMKPYRDLAPGGRLPYKGALQIYYGTVTALDRDVGRLLARLDIVVSTL